jgi:hypothetical protein
LPPRALYRPTLVAKGRDREDRSEKAFLYRKRRGYQANFTEPKKHSGNNQTPHWRDWRSHFCESSRTATPSLEVMIEGHISITIIRTIHPVDPAALHHYAIPSLYLASLAYNLQHTNEPDRHRIKYSTPTIPTLHQASLTPPPSSLGTRQTPNKPSHHPPSKSQIIHQHQSIQKRKPYVQRKVQQAQALTVSHRVQEAAKTPRLPEQHLREFDYPLIERFRQPICFKTRRLSPTANAAKNLFSHYSE